jgi:hypothetical protein
LFLGIVENVCVNNLRLPFLALTFLVGCDGSIVGPRAFHHPPTESVITTPNSPPTPNEPPTSGGAPVVVVPQSACTPELATGSAPLRRLSHEEYEFALADLTQNAALAKQAVAAFSTDPVSLGFRNAAKFLDVKTVQMTNYQNAAEAVATAYISTLNTRLPCATTGGEACANTFIDGFITRAYRRDLTAAERAKYLTIFRNGIMGADFKTGIEWMLVAALQAPHFLYRPEVSNTNVARALSPFELASRLSFLVWQSIPDEALLNAARNGQLVTKQDVAREARRMLQDAKAQRISNFFLQWMDIDEVGGMHRDATVFGPPNPLLAQWMTQEAQEFVKEVVLTTNGNFESLMTAPYSFMNSGLAAHYGITGVTNTNFAKVPFTSQKRGGLLMLGGSIAAHDKETRTSIVNRGVKIRTQVLCQNVPAPPDNVPLNLSAIDGNFTQADRLAQHRTVASCNGCHSLLDPLGEPFEHVNAVGKERTLDEAGRSVKTTGLISQTLDANGAVTDGLDLMKKFSKSREVQQCFVMQLFRFNHARAEETGDACSRERMMKRFEESNFNIQELIVALTQTDDFLNVPAVLP